MTDDKCTIWVCVDCYMSDANGGLEEGQEAEAGVEPWNMISDDDSVTHVTAGMIPDDHHEDCDYRLSYAAREAADVFGSDETHEVFDCNVGCEEKEFSSSRCEGCGSSLAGSRHAFTAWLKS